MKVSTGKIHTIMKTKNIFLTAISALFIFAACTEEKIMDEPGVSGKGDLVIELSPSSVITKAAATNEGYVYATEEELNVEDCWIFVFGENEKYITSQYFSGDALSETENEYVDTPAPNGGSQTYKKGYTITLTGLDYGTYNFWVVANPTEANDAYKSCQSLDALKEIIEGGDSYQTAFAEKADQLVKVGNKSATFDVTTVASPIQIPLTQLAARVELKVRVDIPRQLEGGEYEYPDLGGTSGVLTEAQLAKLFPDGKIPGGVMTNAKELSERDSNGKLKYTYFGHPVTTTSTPKSAHPGALSVIKKTKYKGFLLKEIKLVVEDIRIKSELVPNKEEFEGQLGIASFDPNEDVSTTYSFKFYTYTKEDLKINLTGDLYDVTYQVSQKGEVKDCMFVNDKAPSELVAQINSGNIKEGETLHFAGGNGWGDKGVGVMLCNEETWVAVDETIENSTIEGEVKHYSSGSVTLKPKNGFQVGNMYEASALIQSVPATGSLNIVIENIQSGGEINFGFN